MKKIYSVLVENRSGVLCKVAGLFSRRSFNIDSLAVGETDDKEVSCMTIVSSGNQHLSRSKSSSTKSWISSRYVLSMRSRAFRGSSC